MVWCDFKNEYVEDMLLQGIRKRVQNMIVIIMGGGPIRSSMKNNLHFGNKHKFHIL